jgi:hypothetical protein
MVIAVTDGVAVEKIIHATKAKKIAAFKREMLGLGFSDIGHQEINSCHPLGNFSLFLTTSKEGNQEKNGAVGTTYFRKSFTSIIRVK